MSAFDPSRTKHGAKPRTIAFGELLVDNGNEKGRSHRFLKTCQAIQNPMNKAGSIEPSWYQVTTEPQEKCFESGHFPFRLPGDLSFAYRLVPQD